MLPVLSGTRRKFSERSELCTISTQAAAAEIAQTRRRTKVDFVTRHERSNPSGSTLLPIYYSSLSDFDSPAYRILELTTFGWLTLCVPVAPQDSDC